MKVKEVDRTANVAWSPSALQNIHLACGTVAQQLDATFSTSAKLELFSLDLGIPGPDTTLVGSVNTPHRFHKLVWSGSGIDSDHPKGLIIGGSDNGIISIWCADKIINSNPECSVASVSNHTGAVRSLDVNPFQSNLLASGASESEIFIWDLNNLSKPMSPGNKTHPLEDVTGIAWNRQVQHILASTSPSGRSVVWDLRKNEPIIQVADSSSKIQCSDLAWHPDVATQLVTSSIDDRSPVIQMWDLRYATAPMRTLERHKRGILSLAWCPQDSDLLLSASKDNCVLCWNPNNDVPGGEVVYELPATSQWIFECQWCPRNPAVISTASFDGHVTMYSLLGGGAVGAGSAAVEQETPPPSSGGDFFDAVKSSGNKFPSRSVAVETTPLKTPPKWFRRPCGASFSFGGKLVSFGNTRGAGVPKTVSMSRVVTETEFLSRSEEMEEALSAGRLTEFCDKKIAECSGAADKSIWSFMKVTFEENPRRQFLNLLGYNIEELNKKFLTWSKMVPHPHTSGPLDVQELSQKLAVIPTAEEEEGEGAESRDNASSVGAMYGSDSGDGPSNILDNVSLSDSSTSSKRVSNASVLGMMPTPPPSAALTSISVPTDKDADGFLAQALLVGNFEAAVDICIGSDRMSEALILAVAGGSELLKRTQQVFFQKKPGKVSKLIASVVNKNWTELARQGNLENWKEILAALVTYAGPEEFSPLCDVLGGRLESEQDGQYSCHASLCYICSGNVEKFVEVINRSSCEVGVALDLQAVMEKVVLLHQAVQKERSQWNQSTSSDTLRNKLRQYASLLASQGALHTAYTYLAQDSDSRSTVLKDRLYHAQGLTSEPRPEFPFVQVELRPQARASEVTTSAPAVMAVSGSNAATYPGQVSQGTTGNIGFVPGMSEGETGNIGFVQPGLSRSNMGVAAGQTPRYGGQFNPPVGGSVPGPFSTTASSIRPGGDAMANSSPSVVHATPIPSDRYSNFPDQSMGSNRMMSRGARNEGGWNDPPLPEKKSVGPPATMAPITTPITAPITSPLQNEHPQPQPPVSEVLPAVTSNEPLPARKSGAAPIAPPAAVEEQRPIPEEYVAMIQAFEAMLKRCRGAASNLGTRKKLEDIEKKLAVLCDMLCDARLSPNVIQGLNYMADTTQRQDYRAGLQCYNQMVSMGNFSELSSFLPGIKTLLNLGIQLKI